MRWSYTGWLGCPTAVLGVAVGGAEVLQCLRCHIDTYGSVCVRDECASFSSKPMVEVTGLRMYLVSFLKLYAEKVATRGLCAIAQAESLRYKLLGGLAVRR